MAWLEKQRGVYKVGFRWGQRRYKRSLDTEDEDRANKLLAQVEAKLSDLELGRLDPPPPGTDILVYLLSDGRKTTGKPEAVLTLKNLCEEYLAAIPSGAKEANTLSTEKTHTKHFQRVLGEKFDTRSLSLADLQAYIGQRATDSGRRGEAVKVQTIQKELATFRQMWSWAANHGKLKGAFPSTGLMFPKGKEKPPFQTREEIEAKLERGGQTDVEEEELWDCLYLRLPEIESVLKHVRTADVSECVYPMFCIAAYTGARRSEILRSRIEDFDFKAMMLTLREKKKDQTKTTFRHVPICTELAEAMRAWFKDHPGGSYTICEVAGVPLVPGIAKTRFEQAIAKSNWKGKLRGWHVFRHSFASNCASKGVDQRMIDKWLGHTTDEMRKRYQHLFPGDQHKAMSAVFG